MKPILLACLLLAGCEVVDNDPCKIDDNNMLTCLGEIPKEKQYVKLPMKALSKTAQPEEDNAVIKEPEIDCLKIEYSTDKDIYFDNGVEYHCQCDSVKALAASGEICRVFGHWWRNWIPIDGKPGQSVYDSSTRICRICSRKETLKITEEWVEEK